MDLIYLSDSVCYPFHVSTLGRTNRTWEDVNQVPVKEKKEKIECSKDSKNCSICKSRQKRSLSTYIMKIRRDSEKEKDTFLEEAEEEEDCANDKTNNKDCENKQKSTKPTEKCSQ